MISREELQERIACLKQDRERFTSLIRTLETLNHRMAEGIEVACQEPDISLEEALKQEYKAYTIVLQVEETSY